MKLNKLMCSLLIGGSLSLSLNACVPNLGDDNDSSRVGNNSYVAMANPKSAGQESQKVQSSLRDNIDY